MADISETRKQIKDRQKQLDLSKKLMSKDTTKYRLGKKTSIYILQKPASSKDAILKNPPLGKNILARNQDITNPFDTSKFSHHLNYDSQ